MNRLITSKAAAMILNQIRDTVQCAFTQLNNNEKGIET
jgi:hypothetical protein